MIFCPSVIAVFNGSYVFGVYFASLSCSALFTADFKASIASAAFLLLISSSRFQVAVLISSGVAFGLFLTVSAAFKTFFQ
ncbi:hypothetical protein BU036_03960 [Staphylococcus simulans]|uniref:hypothetical protein n=1 Tax=Staphylococcus simulans TaxID=1286 RepID=UPI000E679427|nr:hypothetical protein [Staphylococcus simulans]RIN50834.1 hypothetical protein BU036_03960 [Staphylococcus simulans]